MSRSLDGCWNLPAQGRDALQKLFESERAREHDPDVLTKWAEEKSAWDLQYPYWVAQHQGAFPAAVALAAPAAPPAATAAWATGGGSSQCSCRLCSSGTTSFAGACRSCSSTVPVVPSPLLVPAWRPGQLQDPPPPSSPASAPGLSIGSLQDALRRIGELERRLTALESVQAQPVVLVQNAIGNATASDSDSHSTTDSAPGGPAVVVPWSPSQW